VQVRETQAEDRRFATIRTLRNRIVGPNQEELRVSFLRRQSARAVPHSFGDDWSLTLFEPTHNLAQNTERAFDGPITIRAVLSEDYAFQLSLKSENQF